jgi:ribosomal protein S18 acetylase RimI-like enzyme
MPARVCDTLDLATFEQVAHIWSLTGVGNPARGDSFESVQATLSHGGRFLTVRNEGDAVVGACWITNDGRRLYLHHMAVDAAQQGKGYGKLLMDAAIDFAREKRLQMKLEVHRDNLRARKLYLACGFAPLGDYEVLIRRDLGKR